MSRNFLSRDDASQEASDNRRNASRNTQSRIFGDFDEVDKKLVEKAKKDLEVVKSQPDVKQPDEQNQSEFDRNKQQNQTSQINSSDLSRMPHQIRYSSFMDNDQKNANKVREQQLIQKQWLDQQIAERKSLDRKNKKSDDLFEESVHKQDAVTSSQSARHKVEKNDMQNQIREYNEALAIQKRANDKKMKDMDKQEANGNFQKASKQDLQNEEAHRQHNEDVMIEKERAMSRDMRQMNTKN